MLMKNLDHHEQQLEYELTGGEIVNDGCKEVVHVGQIGQINWSMDSQSSVDAETLAEVQKLSKRVRDKSSTS